MCVCVKACLCTPYIPFQPCVKTNYTPYNFDKETITPLHTLPTTSNHVFGWVGAFLAPP